MTTRKSPTEIIRSIRSPGWPALALTGALFTVLPAAQAALTDIANAPLASSSTTTVKPNILFTLDDSGSMGRLYMPDSINGLTGDVGWKNHLCNSIYYNPAINYVPAKNADGTDFTAAVFTGALDDAFGGSGTTNLSTNFESHGGDTSQPAYYYRFDGAGTPTNTQCQLNSSSAATHVTGTAPDTFTKVLVSATSGPSATDERQNFANWYSFYRTRMQMMKTATGRAFVGIGASYRVGFITINPGSPVSSSKYLPIIDFDTTQKSNWYTTLYSQNSANSTPLREALSRGGRHFAGIQSGINSGMTGDPMQYSCQQNFNILTSDGFWNSNAGVQLNNSAIANHDGNIALTPRPLYDGAMVVASSLTTTLSYSSRRSNCSGGQRKIRETTNLVYNPVPAGGQPSDTRMYITGCLTNPTIPPTTVTVTTGTTTSGGSIGSLADVAAYYYDTDLRAPGSLGALGTDVGTDNNVPTAGSGIEDDSAQHQHMSTFTLGLGLSGTLNYQPNYKTGAGDFAALRTGALNWPAPLADDPTALDDLWHAAVDGKGQYFSANNPDAVVSGLSAALAGVNARVASAAAAATSNLEPVAGDNFAYTAKYTTVEWSGELEAREIDLITGTVSLTPIWSAQAKLDAKTSTACDNRDIRLFRASATATNKLVNFTWNTQACDGAGLPTGPLDTGLDATEQGFFGATQLAGLTQYPSMTDGTIPTVDQRTAAQGANLVNFVRGQRGLELFQANSLTQLYRQRAAVLGDIVNAQPVFVKAPFASFPISSYVAFKAGPAGSRDPMVYVAANDGMLHAFYAGSTITDPLGGEERWSFIPTMALPKLHKQADTNWAVLHEFSVDGTPAVSDIFDTGSSTWKTILIGGLNGGGKGYYALDVTDPANPKGLWEFKHTPTCAGTPVGQASDCHLGYTYGNPQISKLADGRWVVFVTSGYNNVNTAPVAGDGEGYLYVLDAATGTIIYKIGTGVGNATTPSGLGKINNFVLDLLVNNQTEHVYGGDLLGNLWRFEVNAAQTATKVVTLEDASAVPQPITTRPEIAEFGSPPTTFVYVSTGQYLGTTDLASTQTQTVWGIKDTGTYPIATPRSTMSQLSITAVGTVRSIACLTNCTISDGWYADLPLSGERVNIDMKLQLGTLTVASNVPQNNACTIGGISFLSFFDARNGLQVAGSPSFGFKLSDSLAVGINVVRLPDGRTVVIATTSDAAQNTQEAPIPPGDPQGRRTSWRELVQ